MVAMLGNVGQLIFFFFTLAASVTVGLFTITYAAHCFLTIVEDTAAGTDEVRWPDEPPTDWYGKPFYLLWLLFLPVVPASGVILLFESEILEGPLGILPLLLCITWLIFPLCLWSSLGASTSWLIVHFGMYRRVFRHPGLLGLFYLLTAPILVVAVALVYYGITSPSWLLLPLAAVTGSGLLFIYGRLLGRIAWKACQGLPARKKKKKRLRGLASHDPWAGPVEAHDEQEPVEEIVATPPPPKKRLGKSTAAITTVDPWATPAEPPSIPSLPNSSAEMEEEDEWTPNKKPYGLARPDTGGGPPSKPAPKPQARSDEEEEDEWTPNKKPYALQGDFGVSSEKSQPEPVRRPFVPEEEEDEDEWTPHTKPYGLQPEERKRPRQPEETRITANAPQAEDRIAAPGTFPESVSPAEAPELPQPSRLDRQIYLEPYRPFVPRWTLFSGVWEFPLYATSLQALVNLSALTLILGFFIRVLLLLWPQL